VTVDTGPYVTVARPDITAGRPETAEPTVHAADGIWGRPTHIEESFPNTVPREATIEMLVFVANITNEFILGLAIPRAYDAPVDLGRQTQHLAGEEVLIWSHGTGPGPFSLVVANDHVIPTQCEGVVMARLERPSEWKMAR
jgi:hypothetical protein